MKYLQRFPDARNYLREKGVDTGDTGLKDMASRGTGPKYAIVNGKAVYRPEWLDEWIEAQASRPVKRRRQTAQTSPAA